MRSAATIWNDKCTVDQTSLCYLMLFNFLCYSPLAVICSSSALCTIALSGDLLLFWTSSSHTQDTRNTLRKESSPLPALTALACCSGCANTERIRPGAKCIYCMETVATVGLCSYRLGVEGWVSKKRNSPLFVVSILSLAKKLVLCNDRDLQC